MTSTGLHISIWLAYESKEEFAHSARCHFNRPSFRIPGYYSNPERQAVEINNLDDAIWPLYALAVGQEITARVNELLYLQVDGNSNWTYRDHKAGLLRPKLLILV